MVDSDIDEYKRINGKDANEGKIKGRKSGIFIL